MGIESLLAGQVYDDDDNDREIKEDSDTHPVYQHTEITKIIRKSVLTYMKGAKYQHSKVKEWQNQLASQCLQKLALLKPPFPADMVKYIVTCTVLQKGLSGFHAANSCFWDTELDRLITYIHEDEEFYVVVNVYAIAI